MYGSSRKTDKELLELSPLLTPVVLENPKLPPASIVPLVAKFCAKESDVKTKSAVKRKANFFIFSPLNLEL
jgi:hypothetical protein